jgi:oleate hydratase
MEAVYQLLDVDRGVPEVFGSIYDVRELMKSTALLGDGKKLPIPGFAKKYVKRTIIGLMLEEYGVI